MSNDESDMSTKSLINNTVNTCIYIIYKLMFPFVDKPGTILLKSIDMVVMATGLYLVLQTTGNCLSVYMFDLKMALCVFLCLDHNGLIYLMSLLQA